MPASCCTLGPDMLVLTHRGFDAAGFLEAVAAAKARSWPG